MELMMVGLGRMGGNMARRLVGAGHRVVAFDPNPEARAMAAQAGAEAVDSLEAGVKALSPPRAVWVMVPAGEATETTLEQLAALLAPGDLVADGGNSHFRDSMRRAQSLEARGLWFVDAGTSGGIWGLQEGYCLMVGGTEEAVRRLEPALRALAPPGGLLHTGPVGSGHFVKMVHNGIEYGLLQAYAEGFEILQKGPFTLDLAAVADLWNHGSVVRSWLLELAAEAFRRDPGLTGLKGYVADSGEGRWTVAQALEEDVPAPIITLALLERLRSREEDSFAAKVVAALRNAFGGHPVKRG